LTVTDYALPQTIYLDLVFAKRGRVMAVFTFVNAQKPFDTSPEQQVVKTVSDRVAALRL
jgi:hypothetical protein